MSRIIKNYSKFNSALRDEIYTEYSAGELERTTFPYKGNIVDGVIYKCDEMIYLIPVSTIVMGRSGSSDDLDDDNEPMEVDIDTEEDIEEKKSKE